MLIAQPDLEAATDWRRGALEDLAARLTPPTDFPCTFAQGAFRRGGILFSFVETADEAGLDTAAEDLAAYVALSRDWDGKVENARPLLMIFSEQAARFDSLAGYHQFGWRMLNAFHRADPSPWPPDVATDPKAPFWSFCFAGVQLFVNMSAPQHRRRRSRNLGRCLTFVINPRERFDAVAGDTPAGRKIRAAIRARAEGCDGQPHAPQLGLYQKGELEWPQYALPDDNDAEQPSCPFRFGR